MHFHKNWKKKKTTSPIQPWFSVGWMGESFFFFFQMHKKMLETVVHLSEAALIFLCVNQGSWYSIWATVVFYCSFILDDIFSLKCYVRLLLPYLILWGFFLWAINIVNSIHITLILAGRKGIHYKSFFQIKYLKQMQFLKILLETQ